jgi:hypothetical protein
VPKPKRGTALFDLLAQEEEEGTTPLQVPGWWRREGASPEAADAAPPGRAAESGRIEPTEAPIREDVPFIEQDGERIRVSFTAVTAAVAVFACVVVMLGVFELGRMIGNRSGVKQGAAAARASYASETMNEIEAARRQPPATHLVENLLSRAGPVPNTETGTAAAEVGGPKWIRDYTYVVAQEFTAGHADSARQAKAFLEGRGITTELVRYPSGSVQLITTQGYNRSDPTQRRLADELLNKVRGAGAEFFAQGGGYKLEGYFKTLKQDSF